MNLAAQFIAIQMCVSVSQMIAHYNNFYANFSKQREKEKKKHKNGI